MSSGFKNATGILGGSFDPVHFGHLRLALECIDATGLERVFLIPLYTPTHREDLIATADQRFHMLKLATAGCPQLEVSDIELRRKQPSYTVDTMRELHRQNPHQTLCLIMGMDAFRYFDSWKEWEQLIDLCHIIVAERPGVKTVFQNPILTELFESRSASQFDELKSRNTGMIFKIEIPMLDISSSRIRKLLSLHQHIDYLVPKQVKNFILDEKIYLD